VVDKYLNAVRGFKRVWEVVGTIGVVFVVMCCLLRLCQKTACEAGFC